MAARSAGGCVHEEVGVVKDIQGVETQLQRKLAGKRNLFAQARIVKDGHRVAGIAHGPRNIAEGGLIKRTRCLEGIRVEVASARAQAEWIPAPFGLISFWPGTKLGRRLAYSIAVPLLPTALVLGLVPAGEETK